MLLGVIREVPATMRQASGTENFARLFNDSLCDKKGWWGMVWNGVGLILRRMYRYDQWARGNFAYGLFIEVQRSSPLESPIPLSLVERYLIEILSNQQTETVGKFRQQVENKENLRRWTEVELFSLVLHCRHWKLFKTLPFSIGVNRIIVSSWVVLNERGGTIVSLFVK